MFGAARILLVEDDDDIRGALSSLLQFDGYQVVEAANGQLALNELNASSDFRVVILDLAMPVMDGATFLEHKSRSAQADVPVVIFSSSSFDGLEKCADVCCKVRKMDGTEKLFPAIQRAMTVREAAVHA